MKVSEFRQLIREEVYKTLKETNAKQLNEVGVETIAIGALVAVFGIKMLGTVAKKVFKFVTLNSAEFTKERTPEELTKVLETLTSEALKSSKLSQGDNFMAELLITRRMGDKIKNGEITNLKQLHVEFKKYLESISTI